MAEVPKLDGGKTICMSEQLTVHLVEKSRYGITLLLATGSAQHVDGLRALAATKGLRLDGQGLRRGRKIVAAKEEEDIYAALGLPFIAPELREGQGEIQRALKRKLPKTQIILFSNYTDDLDRTLASTGIPISQYRCSRDLKHSFFCLTIATHPILWHACHDLRQRPSLRTECRFSIAL